MKVFDVLLDILAVVFAVGLSVYSRRRRALGKAGPFTRNLFGDDAPRSQQFPYRRLTPYRGSALLPGPRVAVLGAVAAVLVLGWVAFPNSLAFWLIALVVFLGVLTFIGRRPHHG